MLQNLQGYKVTSCCLVHLQRGYIVICNKFYKEWLNGWMNGWEREKGRNQLNGSTTQKIANQTQNPSKFKSFILSLFLRKMQQSLLFQIKCNFPCTYIYCDWVDGWMGRFSPCPSFFLSRAFVVNMLNLSVHPHLGWMVHTLSIKNDEWYSYGPTKLKMGIMIFMINFQVYKKVKGPV
jgi:hypothetical protein